MDMWISSSISAILLNLVNQSFFSGMQYLGH